MERQEAVIVSLPQAYSTAQQNLPKSADFVALANFLQKDHFKDPSSHTTGQSNK